VVGVSVNVWNAKRQFIERENFLMNDQNFNASFMSQFFVDGERAIEVRPDVREALQAYFSTHGDGYTGSQFENLIANSDPFSITDRDLIAITTLSVDVPARAALWILSDQGKREVSSLLQKIPIDTDIWDSKVNNIFSDDGPVMDLWRMLGQANWPISKTGGGLGGVTKRSKILAAKRPRLIPVLDRVVKGTLPETGNIWVAIQNVLMNDEWRTKLQKALQHENVPDSVSLLRKIDVVIWVNNEKRFRRKNSSSSTDLSS
jgi:hypothetical protein